MKVQMPKRKQKKKTSTNVKMHGEDRMMSLTLIVLVSNGEECNW